MKNHPIYCCLFSFLMVCLSFNIGASFPIPDTGQTNCYDDAGSILIPDPLPGEPFYGQDGNYVINPFSYTKLDADGNDLPKTAAEWVMVRDNVTGLIWEIKQARNDVKDYANPHDGDNTYSWFDSHPETNGGHAGSPGDGSTTFDTQHHFIQLLNTQAFGGFSDWRMPTMKELFSLAHAGKAANTIDTSFFPNMSGAPYWTSDSSIHTPDKAWQVRFWWLDTHENLKSENTYTVLAVRGVRKSGHFVDNGDNTLTDVRTGLMWEKQGNAQRGTWANALDYCKNLTLSGYDDWRLPNVKELQSIANYNQYNPAIDSDFFPNTKTDWGYWSSTTDASDLTQGFFIHFLHGALGNFCSKTDSFYRLAVRGGQEQPPDRISITSPMQADNWSVGVQKEIAWNPNGTSGNVIISLSRDGGKTYKTLNPGTANDGSYLWTVTGPESYNCALKIEPIDNPAKANTQSLFTIAYDLNAGLVAYYPFNGNANDESGNGNHGTVNGASLSSDRFGNHGKSYSFDGLDDYITIPHSSTLDIGRIEDDYTLSFWIKTKDVGLQNCDGGSRFFLSKYDRFSNTQIPFYFAIYSTTQLAYWVYDKTSGFDLYSNDPINNGKWRHVSTVTNRSDGKTSLYIDGILNDSDINNLMNSNNTAAINIGRDVICYYESYAKMEFDDFRIYNRALSGSEIQTLFRFQADSTPAGIIVEPNYVIVSEPNGYASVVVKLNPKPLADVTIRFFSSNPTEFTLSPEIITLNGANWSIGESVTVRAEADHISDGDQTTMILSSNAESGDERFNGQEVPDILVMVVDNSTELVMDSVSPTYGLVGHPLNVTITGSGFDGSTVLSLKYPDNTTQAVTITSEISNKISAVLPNPGVAGEYTLTAVNANGTCEIVKAVTFAEQPALDVQKMKKAIVVAGGHSFAGNDLWTSTERCAAKAYQTLTAQGYTPDTIQFLAGSISIDATGDGVNDVDGQATSASLQEAITTWAADPLNPTAELLIYLTGQGKTGGFQIENGASPVWITPETLDGWLDQLSLSGKIIVIYDACRSGSFLAALSAPNRVLLTGTSSDEPAWFLNDGEISFSWFFWDSIFSQAGVIASFEAAARMINLFQTPLLDMNGDGLPDDLLSGKAVRYDDILLGRARQADPAPPIIETVSCLPEELFGPDASVTLSAGPITDNGSSISRVSADIITPIAAYQNADEPVIVNPNPPVKLQDLDQNGIYENSYSGFAYKGNYTVRIQAIDRSGLQSLPKTTGVVQHSGIVITPGDLNIDGKVDITDALNALKTGQGEYVFGLFPAMEVSGDKRIGPEEAGYALQKMAGLR
jgi:hypothetical protein